jgi:hypothetical protein
MLLEKDGKRIQNVGIVPAGHPEHGEARHAMGNGQWNRPWMRSLIFKYPLDIGCKTFIITPIFMGPLISSRPVSFRRSTYLSGNLKFGTKRIF